MLFVDMWHYGMDGKDVAGSCLVMCYMVHKKNKPKAYHNVPFVWFWMHALLAAIQPAC